MIILGLNAYHGDSSACIVVDGRLVAAAEEERFTRIKHWAGLPVRAIAYCLEESGAALRDIDHIAINRDPRANFIRKSLFALAKRPSLRLVTDRLKNASRLGSLADLLATEFGVDRSGIRAGFTNVEHHTAHLAGSFFVSPFSEAAVVSLDGFGDFVGAMWGVGKDNSIDILHRTYFPHSLGLLYLAFTQYLGFPKYGDEYKVMGLAAYGEPEFMGLMRRVIKTPEKTGSGKSSPKLFELDLDYFIHHSEGVTMTWEGGEPLMGPVFSKKLDRELGPARKAGDEISQRHMNVASSLQRRYEEVLFHVLNEVHQKTGSRNLALSGGCAMNSVANGKIFQHTPFSDIYMQPASGDAGGAIGAAYYVWNRVLNRERSYVLSDPYLGPAYPDDFIARLLEAKAEELTAQGCAIELIHDETELCRATAQEIANGLVVGWFQGRMEWGPRALGNRSIVCDPRRADMKDILNLKIKRRESFRPFAPSIQLEAVRDYFETDYPDPFMMKVYSIRPEKRGIIPAVTHVDGTGRLQTVDRECNPVYWLLIEEFRKITGVPVVLNTSFNENEPIVCRPQEALDCFLRTKMDLLVLGKHLVRRTGTA